MAGKASIVQRNNFILGSGRRGVKENIGALHQGRRIALPHSLKM